MLIRSQDKTAIVNVSNVFDIGVRDINKGVAICIGSSNSYRNIAEYSVKAKAMKVLNMIQEAYADVELTKAAIPETTKLLKSLPRTEENSLFVSDISKILKNAMVFQMPENSEVEA